MGLIGALAGLALGGYIGFVLGRRFKAEGARGKFWMACGASLALGVLLIFAGEVVGLPVVAGGGLGLMTGGLNGLRWGMGRLSDTTPGPGSASGPRVIGDEADATHPDRDIPRADDHRPHPAT